MHPSSKLAKRIENGDRTWSYEQLLEMDRRFVERMRRAITDGDEHPCETPTMRAA
jgi:hypothetical protein